MGIIFIADFNSWDQIYIKGISTLFTSEKETIGNVLAGLAF